METYYAHANVTGFANKSGKHTMHIEHALLEYV